MKLRLRALGSEEAVDVQLDRTDRSERDSFWVRCGELQTEIAIDTGEHGDGCLYIHGRVVPYYAVWQGRTVHVWMAGKTYILESEDAAARRAPAAAGPALLGDVKAPMPGRVLRIAVGRGDLVEAHQPIVILESMKMEMTLSVPRAGRVAEIVCEEGEMVEMGAVLVKLEPVETA